MNRAGKLGKKSLPAAETHHKKSETKEKPNPRNPLKELNSSSCSTSIETPRGCFRFLLSNSSSKTTLPRSKSLPKTPKSAPNPRTLHQKNPPPSISNPRSKPPKKNPPKSGFEIPNEPRSHNPEKPRSSYLLQWQNGKRPVFGGQFRERDLQSKAHKHQSLVETDTGKPSQLMDVLEDNGNSVMKLRPEFRLFSTQEKFLEGESSTQLDDLGFRNEPRSHNPQKPRSSNLLQWQNGQRPVFGGQFAERDQQSKVHKHQSLVETDTGKSNGTPVIKLTSELSFLSTQEKFLEGESSTQFDDLGFRTDMNATPVNQVSSWSCLVSTPNKASEEHFATPPLHTSISPKVYSGKPFELRFGPQLDINSTPANKFSSGSHLVSVNDETLEERSLNPTPNLCFRTPNMSFRGVSEMNDTPINKSTSGCRLLSTPETTTTPPIQASISPEIICGSSLVSTPACFAAGHVVVGVSDKRKCRPRGILTVGEEGDDLGFCASRTSLVPTPAEASMRWHLSPKYAKEGVVENGSPEYEGLVGPTTSADSVLGLSDGSVVRVSCNPSPAEASMKWLLSPCEDATNGDVDKRSPEFGGLVGPITSVSDATPSSGHGFCSSSSTTSPCSGILEGTATLFGSKFLLPQEGKGYRYDHMVENSPLSVDSWGSRNVICTPVSDSSSDGHARFSWMNMENISIHQLDLNTMAGDLQAASFSAEGQFVTCNHADVKPMPNVSFQFSCPATLSNSIDVTQALKPLHDQAFRTEESCRWEEGMSSSNFEHMSQVRISWREGLISRIFEMDELNFCQWLAEGEEDANYGSDNRFKSDSGHEINPGVTDSTLCDQNDQPLADGVASPEFVYDEQDDRKGKGKLPSCAESISTDGGGLVASGDSDWATFYKNQLFEV